MIVTATSVSVTEVLAFNLAILEDEKARQSPCLVLGKGVVDHLQCEDCRQVAGQDEDRALGREDAGRDAAVVLSIGVSRDGLLQLE